MGRTHRLCDAAVRPTIRTLSAIALDRPLVLASASPRRAALLRAAGIAFVIQPTPCDESPLVGELPVELARRLARAKAEAVATTDAIVLAADTVVWNPVLPIPLGKPEDPAEAHAMLRGLAGVPHRVTTAWALAGAVPCEVHDTTTEVGFRSLSDEDIARYLATDEWRDKAGGYAIQGEGMGLVDTVSGSYTAVVGLPLAEVLARLEQLGVVRR